MSEIVLTFKETVVLFPALEELVATTLPAKTAYRIGKIHRKIKVEMEGYEKARVELIQRLGVKDEGKESWTVIEENVSSFQKEMEALLSENFTLLDVSKIDFKDIESINIKPSSIINLESLLEGLD